MHLFLFCWINIIRHAKGTANTSVFLNGIQVPLTNTIKKQESIPVGCVLHTCQPYMFLWLPLGVSTGGGSHRHPPVSYPSGWGWYPPPLDIPTLLDIPSFRHTHPHTYSLHSFVDILTFSLWVSHHLLEQNDRHLWKHYLPATSFAGDNYEQTCNG